MKIGAFTKSFRDWPISVVSHRFQQIGLDGMDLTVRHGGHVEPKDAAAQLPLAAKSALEAGTEILILTTEITEPSAEAEQILAAASKLGISHAKLGYYIYKPFGTLAKQMDAVRKQLAVLIKLFKRYEVLPCVHIHSGTDIPSHGTMLYELIRDFAPDEIGAYVDMLHMVLEGGSDGWREGLDLLAPWIALVAVKNFTWEADKRDKLGQLRWKHKVVPLADGISPIPDYVGVLKKIGYDGIYSLHSEYKGTGSFKDLDTEACLTQTAEDLKFLKKLLNSSNSGLGQEPSRAPQTIRNPKAKI
jgi:sugar phosphate isomerase/epimerase